VGNLHLAATMHDVALERGRHAGAAERVWSELGARLDGIDGCADAASRDELWRFMRGLEATERSHLAALERAGSVAEARRISEIYGAGADDLFARMPVPR
jgi:hypothetical protein